MKCIACDTILKDWESYWRQDLGTYEDMCRKCRNMTRVTDEDLGSADRVEIKEILNIPERDRNDY